MWHSAQVTVACALVSGNPVALWSKTPAAHVVMGWHVEQAAAVVGKPAVTWFGTLPPIVVVLWNAAEWHP
jgi:hypothetical protein